MRTCPKCGSNIDGMKFCRKCGTNVEHLQLCPKCGSDISGMTYCRNCGERVDTIAVSENAPAIDPSSDRTTLLDKLKKLPSSDTISLKSEIKHLQKENDELKALLTPEMRELHDIQNEIQASSQRLKELEDSIAIKSEELIDLDNELAYQNFGLYRPKYNCTTSGEYKEKIKEIRDRQKEMISAKTALSYFDNWTLDGSKAKGSAMNNDNMKMVLLAFNGECDTIINKVKFNNVYKIEEQIHKSAERINRINKRNKISIKPEYIALKVEELYLSYEYEVKKQEEKEELRRIREEEREEQRLKREIEEARKLAAKEQQHYRNALAQIQSQLQNASSDEERDSLIEKEQEISEHLGEIDEQMKQIDYRETNQRAGYVYVISNIGSFGENVYKIGMTRRLDPTERVDELGDASVPFNFDIHAMIFSDDAPSLENALHKAFADRKLNLVNQRREFFNVSLDEIKEVVKANYDKTVEFIEVPEAEQYRTSLKMKH